MQARGPLWMFLALILLASSAASARDGVKCSLSFDLKGWSAFLERASGDGRVTCDDGSEMDVQIRIKGAGLTAGRWRIEDGSGVFSAVDRIEDVLGAYFSATANAGAGRAATAMALTKRDVSLALSGTGSGFNVGVAGTRVKIRRRR